MSHRTDVEKGILVYTCCCGWVDRGHANPGAYAFDLGARGLWNQMLFERGTFIEKDVQGKQAKWFPVVFREREGALKHHLEDGHTGHYKVRAGLTRAEKESVALAIFLQVSIGFESVQADWRHRWVTDSGFSQEDLTSDLLGFYTIVRGNSWERLCKPVSMLASLVIWDKYGAVGSKKVHNPTQPNFYPCVECSHPRQATMLPPPLDKHSNAVPGQNGNANFSLVYPPIPPQFPSEFQSIQPAQEGTLYHRVDAKYFLKLRLR